MDYLNPFTINTREDSNPATPQPSHKTQAGKKLKPRDRDWETIFSAWSKSDLSQAEFCRQHSIKKSAFYYRQKKDKRQQKSMPPKLLPIEVSKIPSPMKEGSAHYQLFLPNGTRLSIPNHYQQETLAPLLKLLGIC